MGRDEVAQEAMLMYVAIDVSESMGAVVAGDKSEEGRGDHRAGSERKKVTARDAANSALQHLFKAGFKDPMLRDLVKLGVVVFNDDARVLRKAWEPTVNGLDIDPLPKPEGVTDFKRLFEKLTALVSEDAKIALQGRIRIKDPAVFLLSDGAPYVNGQVQRPEVYRGAVRALQGLRLPRYQFPDEPEPEPGEPVVVPFGIGSSHSEALCEVVSPGYAPYQTDTSEVGDVVTQVMGAILDSLTASAASRRITVVPPRKGIKALDCDSIAPGRSRVPR